MASHSEIPLRKSRIRQQHKNVGVSVWYVFGICFISIVVALTFTIFYVKHVQDQAKQATASATAQSEKRAMQQRQALCQAMDIMQQEYANLGTPNAKDVAATWGQMEKIVGCPGHDGAPK